MHRFKRTGKARHFLFEYQNTRSIGEKGLGDFAEILTRYNWFLKNLTVLCTWKRIEFKVIWKYLKPFAIKYGGCKIFTITYERVYHKPHYYDYGLITLCLLWKFGHLWHCQHNHPMLLKKHSPPLGFGHCQLDHPMFVKEVWSSLELPV